MGPRADLRVAIGSPLAGLLILSACSKSTPPAPTDTAPAFSAPTLASPALSEAPALKAVYRVGERAEAPDYALTLENVKECKTKYYNVPRKGNLKLGVEAVFEGLAEKEAAVNPFYAKVFDSEGHSYSATFGGCEPGLNVVRLVKGEKATGWITFELPGTARGLKLTYDPITFGPKQAVKIDLGR